MTILDQVTFGAQTTNQSAARKPNGIGDFVIGEHSFGKNNDGTSSTTDFSNAILKIWPNPADQFIYIADTNAPVFIYDLNGKLVIHREQYGAEEIDISSLSDAMYLVNSGTTIQKLVVMR